MTRDHCDLSISKRVPPIFAGVFRGPPFYRATACTRAMPAGGESSTATDSGAANVTPQPATLKRQVLRQAPVMGHFGPIAGSGSQWEMEQRKPGQIPMEKSK